MKLNKSTTDNVNETPKATLFFSLFFSAHKRTEDNTTDLIFYLKINRIPVYKVVDFRWWINYFPFDDVVPWIAKYSYTFYASQWTDGRWDIATRHEIEKVWRKTRQHVVDPATPEMTEKHVHFGHKQKRSLFACSCHSVLFGVRKIKEIPWILCNIN